MSAKTSPRSGAGGGPRQWLTPRRVTVLVLVALVLVLVLENTQKTQIRLVVPLVTMPLWLALLGTGLIGAVAGALFMGRRG